jgi:hypothetical protein
VWAKNGKVYVNDIAIAEPYLTQKTRDFPRTKVPKDSYFVMGDNRFELARLPVRARVHPARRDHRQGVLPGLASVPVDRSLVNRIPG